jgi:hypothetical protein
MHGITSLSVTLSGAPCARLAAVVAACALATACSQTPASPTMPTATGTATVATAAVSSAQETSQTWQDFAARGWHCRTPVPGVAVCSPPNQPVVIPPPEDRPPTVLLKRWTNDVFDANVLWIRPEFYHGQPCGPTGESYRFLAVVGYFECVHPVGN